MSPGVLYISYDGMLEPLGQSQVLAYLERLAPGRRIHLISFEKSADWADKARRSAVVKRIEAAGIRWHPMRYHKSPSAPATAYDVAVGSARAVAIARKHRLSIVHARSYVPGVMALAVKRLTGARLLFDMRGFWADEKVDGGLWPRGGTLYRVAKRVERTLLLAADHAVILTHAAERELRSWSYLRGRDLPITVIPTCADLDRFTVHRPPQRDPFVLGYVGSVGTWYLLEDMLRFFKAVRSRVPGARLLIVNRDAHDDIRSTAAEEGIEASELDLRSATQAEIPALIATMSAGMAFYRPGYSRIACAPTKLAEYLACGVPCVGSADVGDMGGILTENKVGIAIRGFAESELADCARKLVALAAEDGIRDRCRKTAIELFSLEAGVEAYAGIYDALSGGNSACG